ncbi:MAG: quaternary ammonium compound efflux SMR transporter SugE [Burkholderiaceae bacterium]
MSPSVAWAILLVAGLFEVVWAVALKYSDGFSRLVPSVIVVVGAAVSFWLLALAMRVLPAGSAYAVWVGVGAAGTAIFGMILLGEPATAARLFCLALILVGVLGLKWLGS